MMTGIIVDFFCSCGQISGLPTIPRITMHTTEGKQTVTQDNALITATYSMGLQEKRLLIASISRLDPTSKAWLKGSQEVVVTVSQWLDIYQGNSKNAYRELKDASRKLYDRSVRIWGDSKHGKDVRWLAAWEYNEGDSRVVLTFSGTILHYLTGMLDEFTSYDLFGVRGLKSIHSVRLYELASQFKGTGWRYIDLDELRVMFALNDSYPDWRDLRKRVIERSCQEISEKSDLCVEYEAIKRGRRVVAIKLKITEKDQLDLF